MQYKVKYHRLKLLIIADFHSFDCTKCQYISRLLRYRYFLIEYSSSKYLNNINQLVHKCILRLYDMREEIPAHFNKMVRVCWKSYNERIEFQHLHSSNWLVLYVLSEIFYNILHKNNAQLVSHNFRHSNKIISLWKMSVDYSCGKIYQSILQEIDIKIAVKVITNIFH